jgi:hypothetical protein
MGGRVVAFLHLKVSSLSIRLKSLESHPVANGGIEVEFPHANIISEKGFSNTRSNK